MTMRKIIIGCVFISLAACSGAPVRSSADVQSNTKIMDSFALGLNTWMGISIDELIAKNGSPPKMYALGEGVRELEYPLKGSRNLAIHAVPVVPQTRPSRIQYGAPVNNSEWGKPEAITFNNQFPADLVYFPNITAPLSTVAKTSNGHCVVTFRIASNDLVESWSSTCD
jgi:hypothetical protein